MALDGSKTNRRSIDILYVELMLNDDAFRIQKNDSETRRARIAARHGKETRDAKSKVW